MTDTGFSLLHDNRIRKVRCSRTWPSCARCTEKRIDCHYGNLIPSAYDPLRQYTLGLGRCVLSSMADVVSFPRRTVDLVKGMHPDSRVAELEARIS